MNSTKIDWAFDTFRQRLSKGEDWYSALNATQINFALDEQEVKAVEIKARSTS